MKIVLQILCVMKNLKKKKWLDAEVLSLKQKFKHISEKEHDNKTV